uniref:Condensin-2 complex subunit H2 n=1 Tax=Kalanchoe fedtschenkoi TaxID=63787 RepID=A0A7N0T1Z6_KALFE
MEKDGEGESAGRFHTVQPHRDLESNWGVDIAKSLEEYLLKICSVEVGGDDGSQHSVNFAEAALLIQGSTQVYSRKVDSFYNLVLHALEFISQKGQQIQTENTTDQPEEGNSGQQPDEEDDFWVSDDIPVDPKNKLDSTSGKDAIASHFVKPPANLVVLEGDCLDTTGDAGELESYLLATCNLYRDFILLDPFDAATVDDFLKENEYNKRNWTANRGSSLGPRSGKSSVTPMRQTGGSGFKSSNRKTLDNNLKSPGIKGTFENVDNDVDPDPSTCRTPPNDDCAFDMNDDYSDHGELSNDAEEEEDDVWQPLNPHEPGNLKIKPFKKVKHSRKFGVNSKLSLIASQFPLAKLHGPISPELTKIWEARVKAKENQKGLESPPLYEKLRESLNRGANDKSDAFPGSAADKGNSGYDNNAPDFEENEADMPYMDEDIPYPSERDDVHANFNANEEGTQEDPSSQASLEDLCRSHLDALLASIAETEIQTELAARVSSWKQKIETNLEEQESLPPFDIHQYGDRIMDKLTLDMESGASMSFADVVQGQEKHDVARTFSAMLQLVNNGDVDLDKGSPTEEPICFTAVNPFCVRLLNRNKKSRKIHLSAAKRKAKSPVRRANPKDSSDRTTRKKPFTAAASPSKFSSKTSGKVALKFGGVKRTPDTKRRRKLRPAEPVDLTLAE